MAGLTQNDLLRMKEKIEVLGGERGDKRKSAIRMEYLLKLQELIGNIKGSANELKLLVERIDADVGTLQGDVQAVQADVSYLQTDVGALKTDVVDITATMAEIQQDLGNASSDLQTLENDILSLQNDVNDLASLDARVDDLETDLDGVHTAVSAVVIPDMTQGNVTAAPTDANFNALVADVAALRQSVVNLKTAIA